MSSHINFQHRYTTRKQEYTPIYVHYDFGRGLEESVFRGGCIFSKDTYLQLESSFDDAVNSIQPGCIIYPNVTLGVNVKIERNVTLKEGVSLGDNTIIKDFALLGKNSIIEEGCVIGELCQVSEETCLPSGTVLAPYTTVASYALTKAMFDPESKLATTPSTDLLRTTVFNVDADSPLFTEQWTVQGVFSNMTSEEVIAQFPELTMHLSLRGTPKMKPVA